MSKLDELREKQKELNRLQREAEALSGDGNRYERHRKDAALRSRHKSTSGRDIGTIPPIANVTRRAEGRFDFQHFCNTYNPRAFHLGWSKDQVKAARLLEDVVLRGALYAFAEPRGGGKTTRCRMAVLWATAYAHWRFPVLIGSENGKAVDSLDAIKTYMRFLPRFVEDFPEIAFAAIALGGIAQRASGQLCHGRPTGIEWSQNRIILPTVPPPENWQPDWALQSDGMVPTSGSIVMAVGLTADGIRGTSITLPTGETVRPDGVLIDDPQTRESARSPLQNATREQLVSADVLGMAGPGKQISAMMPCTIIYPGDMADRLTERRTHPLWRGERTRMLASMPTNMKAWDAYFEVYRQCALLDPPNFDAANEYYIANRAVLDEGAEATWEGRKLPSDVSAIQHAMHMYFRDPYAFASEYQSTPIGDLKLTESRQLTESDLATKLNTVSCGTVPRECNRLTAFVDIQAEILYYAICGWTDKFGGALIDYGTYPPQPTTFFTADNPPRKLSEQHPRLERPARIYAGLNALVPVLLSKQWPQVDSESALSISLALIDAGFETEAVHDFLSRSPLKAVLHASKGTGLKADSKPLNEYRNEPGDRHGWNWRIDKKSQAKGRFVLFDTYPWKSKTAEALLASPGSAGSMYLGGSNLQRDHPHLAIHLLSEYRIETSGRGRKVEVWKPRPDKSENHWWDCIVGCAVAASVLGIHYTPAEAAGEPVQTNPPKPKVDHRAEFERQRAAFEVRRAGR